MTAIRIGGPEDPDADLCRVVAVAFLGLLGRLALPSGGQARRVLPARREPARQDGRPPAQARADRRPRRPGAGGVLGAPSPSSSLPHRIDDAARLARAPGADPRRARAEIARAHRCREALRLCVKRKLPPADGAGGARPQGSRARLSRGEPAPLPESRAGRPAWSASRARRARGSAASSRCGTGTWRGRRAGPSWSATRSAARSPARPSCSRPSVPGQGIVLTIDATLQYLAEKEVDAAWRRTRAKAAMAVAMDPRTGEILAMAIRPTFNPNAFATATDDERRNRAVTDPFEPGSTFKVIMAAAALEEGVVTSHRSHLRRERRDHDRQRHHPRLEEVRLAHLHRGAPELLQCGLDQGRALSSARSATTSTSRPSASARPPGLGLPGESRGQLRPPARGPASPSPPCPSGRRSR